jgi:hypothetical protein
MDLGAAVAACIAQLPTLGIDAVINLALPTSSNALHGEAALITGLGISYLQIPVPWQQPEIARFEQFCDVMRAYEHRRLWVHCASLPSSTSIGA